MFPALECVLCLDEILLEDLQAWIVRVFPLDRADLFAQCDDVMGDIDQSGMVVTWCGN